MMKPRIVTLDAVSSPYEERAYEPIVKRVPEDAERWTFERLVRWLLTPETGELNPEPMNLAEQNLAEKITGYLALTGEDRNTTLQLMVPDSEQGPFSLQQKVKEAQFSERSELLDSGEDMTYLALDLRAVLYDKGG